jgi:hypothetical protein
MKRLGAHAPGQFVFLGSIPTSLAAEVSLGSANSALGGRYAKVRADA